MFAVVMAAFVSYLLLVRSLLVIYSL